jgi:hypothetical protein
MWKAVAMAHFKYILQHVPEGTEENKLGTAGLISLPVFQLTYGAASILESHILDRILIWIFGRVDTVRISSSSWLGLNV